MKKYRDEIGMRTAVVYAAREYLHRRSGRCIPAPAERCACCARLRSADPDRRLRHQRTLTHVAAMYCVPRSALARQAYVMDLSLEGARDAHEQAYAERLRDRWVMARPEWENLVRWLPVCRTAKFWLDADRRRLSTEAITDMVVESLVTAQQSAIQSAIGGGGRGRRRRTANLKIVKS